MSNPRTRGGMPHASHRWATSSNFTESTDEAALKILDKLSNLSILGGYAVAGGCRGAAGAGGIG